MAPAAWGSPCLLTASGLPFLQVLSLLDDAKAGKPVAAPAPQRAALSPTTTASLMLGNTPMVGALASPELLLNPARLTAPTPAAAAVAVKGQLAQGIRVVWRGVQPAGVWQPAAVAAQPHVQRRGHHRRRDRPAQGCHPSILFPPGASLVARSRLRRV